MATSFIAQMIITLAKGIVGKTATLTFKPVMKTGKKCLATRPCVCGYKHAVVFRAVENADMYAVVCPKCQKTAYKVVSATDMQAAAQKGMSEGVKSLTCKATKKDGSPCRYMRKDNSDFCGVHQQKQETRF